MNKVILGFWFRNFPASSTCLIHNPSLPFQVRPLRVQLSSMTARQVPSAWLRHQEHRPDSFEHLHDFSQLPNYRMTPHVYGWRGYAREGWLLQPFPGTKKPDWIEEQQHHSRKASVYATTWTKLRCKGPYPTAAVTVGRVHCCDGWHQPMPEPSFISRPCRFQPKILCSLPTHRAFFLQVCRYLSTSTELAIHHATPYCPRPCCRLLGVGRPPGRIFSYLHGPEERLRAAGAALQARSRPIHLRALLRSRLRRVYCLSYLLQSRQRRLVLLQRQYVPLSPPWIAVSEGRTYY